MKAPTPESREENEISTASVVNCPAQELNPPIGAKRIRIHILGCVSEEIMRKTSVQRGKNWSGETAVIGGSQKSRQEVEVCEVGTSAQDTTSCVLGKEPHVVFLDNH